MLNASAESYHAVFSYNSFDMNGGVLNANSANYMAIFPDTSVVHGTVAAAPANPIPAGETVTLTVTPDPNYAISRVRWSSGTEEHVIELEEGAYRFEMPEGIVTVSASFDPIFVSVPYVDASGKTQTASAHPLSEYETDLEPGWYVVNSDITLDHWLRFMGGEVHLILADGCTIRFNEPSASIALLCMYDENEEGGSLFVYGQSEGTGAFKVNGYCSPFATDASFTQNGGVLDFSMTGCAYTERDFTINGGSFTAHCLYDPAILSAGDFRMKGGTLEASSLKNSAVQVYGSAVISGGQFTAFLEEEEEEESGSAERWGLACDGDLTLSCADADDFITADSYHAYGIIQIPK